MITDTTTGEVIETITQAKEAWLEATQAEKAAKKRKDALKAFIDAEIEANSGNPIEFEDGYAFKKVNSQSFIVEPSVARDLLGYRFWDCLKPDAVDLRTVADLVESGVIPKPHYKKLLAEKVPFRATSYVKLERASFDRKGD